MYLLLQKHRWCYPVILWAEAIIFRIEIDWKQKYIDCLNNDKIEDVMRKGILWQ